MQSLTSKAIASSHPTGSLFRYRNENRERTNVWPKWQFPTRSHSNISGSSACQQLILNVDINFFFAPFPSFSISRWLLLIVQTVIFFSLRTGQWLDHLNDSQREDGETTKEMKNDRWTLNIFDLSSIKMSLLQDIYRIHSTSLLFLIQFWIVLLERFNHKSFCSAPTQVLIIALVVARANNKKDDHCDNIALWIKGEEADITTKMKTFYSIHF